MAASLTSIILPAYVPTKELERITQQCLESLAQTTPPDSYELIVVDNGSIESAARLLREHADIYIRKEAPLGYARATNIGLALANHDWPWFSCWITRRKIIREVGYFDESLAYRFHDQDLG
jgi:GT2 family glycosyltransferase